MNNKDLLVVIPARGGSKRLPNKNILPLAGKPVIAWTIEAAKRIDSLSTLIVSTDHPEIANISKQYGAEVPFFRPDYLSNDKASSIDVIYHALSFYEKQSVVFKYIMLLQPSSPLRTHFQINAALNMLDNQTKSVVSVCEAEHSPIWTNNLPKDLSMKNFIDPEYHHIRSQDLPIFYRLNGAIYIAEIDTLKKHNGFLSPNTKAYIMSQLSSVDVDTQLDFDFCEFLIKKHNFTGFENI